MAIVHFPTDVIMQATVECIICQRRITLAMAAAGLYDASGKLTFFCAGHFWSLTQLIVGLADYVIKERLTTNAG